MKTLFNTFILFVLPAFMFLGCQSRTNQLSVSDTIILPFENLDKEEIIKEVRIEFDKGTAAINRHDAEELYTYLWNSAEFLASGNGEVTKGWEENYKSASSIHSNPEYQSFYIEYDEIIIRVINRDAVVVTGDGYFKDFPGEDGRQARRRSGLQHDKQ